MADIKPMTAITGKWQNRAAASTEDYRRGVETTTKSWATNTAAAASAFKAGVTAAANAGRFEAGVRAAGDQKWKSMAAAKGPARWAEGIGLSGDAYARGFQPYHDVLANLTLPERGPRGDTRNYDRVKAVGQALHNKRVGGGR